MLSGQGHWMPISHQVPEVQLLIPLFYFEGNLLTPGEETLRETPKLCCLLETQPDHDGVKDHDGGVEDHDDHGVEGSMLQR